MYFNWKKIILFLSALIAVVYFFFVWKNNFQNENFASFPVFSDGFRRAGLLFALLCLHGAILVGTKTETGALQILPWSLGVLGILVMAAGLSYFVNPHSIFPNLKYPPITPSARLVKFELYNLHEQVDLVVLGSSRAFTISPGYLKKTIGIESYNMSVEGGRVQDYLIQLRFLLSKPVKPKVLLVEIGHLSFGSKDLGLQPVGLIPYMPLDWGIDVSLESLRDVFGFQAFSDSMYLLSLPNIEGRFRTWTFEGNGLAVRKSVSHESYVNKLEDRIKTDLQLAACGQVDRGSAVIFEDFLRQAGDNDLQVVLYFSPVNIELYRALRENDLLGHGKCIDLYDSYFERLAVRFSNVLYRNLLGYEDVGNLGEDGFYDAIHLKPNASEKTIDALSPEIEAALRRAESASQEARP